MIRSGAVQVQKECKAKNAKPATAAETAKIANRIIWAIVTPRPISMIED